MAEGGASQTHHAWTNQVGNVVSRWHRSVIRTILRRPHSIHCSVYPGAPTWILEHQSYNVYGKNESHATRRRRGDGMKEPAYGGRQNNYTCIRTQHTLRFFFFPSSSYIKQKLETVTPKQKRRSSQIHVLDDTFFGTYSLQNCCHNSTSFSSFWKDLVEPLGHVSN